VLVVSCLAAALGLTVPAPAGAGGASTSTTTPTGGGGGGSTSTTTPGSTTTTVAPPVNDPGANEEVHDDQPVPADVEVPLSSSGEVSTAIIGDLDGARARMADVEARLADATTRVDELEQSIADLDERLSVLEIQQRQAVRHLDSAREIFAERAVDAYVRGNNPGLDAILRAEDPSQLEANSSFVSTVLDADVAAVQDYLEARAALTIDLVEAADQRFENREELTRARQSVVDLTAEAEDAAIELAAFEAGSEIFVSGFVFPVDDPHSFISSFGFPRGGGTRQHQGNDIFAPSGTELYACERGVITNMGTNSLGGIKLWVAGESGTTYYYAHLSGFADGVRDGMVVEAGDLVGYVGNTGNAASTPAHLHFEIHPNGGPAVDPYPLLSTVDAIDGGMDPDDVEVATA